jgi:hypothetical protein
MQIMLSHKRKQSFALFLSLIFVFSGCGGVTGELPVEQLKELQKDVATYSILLEDMKEEGNFLKTYFHKYRVVQEQEGWTTDWVEVPENYYQMNEQFLGMSLVTKKEGEYNNKATPPGYGYVGDQRYGRWRRDERGGSFWEWYGKYALFSSLFGGWYRPIYMRDYDVYRGYSSRNRPFFGRNQEFGSSGSITKKTKPSFYTRYKSKQSSGRSRFLGKVSSRVGRSSGGFRGRAGGFGK